jgi:hypothetical protein
MKILSFKSASLGRKLIVAAGSILLATAAAAECTSQGCFEVYVEELYPTAEGGVWVKTSGDETLANCTANSNVFLRLNVTAGYKDIYATLLAAQIADKRVNIRVAEGTNPCTIAYVTLNRNTW